MDAHPSHVLIACKDKTCVCTIFYVLDISACIRRVITVHLQVCGKHCEVNESCDLGKASVVSTD